MPDLEAIHEGERLAVLEAIGEQAVEMDGQPMVSITCPCGVTVSLPNAYRCFYCDIYFCRGCAPDHFDENKEQ